MLVISLKTTYNNQEHATISLQLSNKIIFNKIGIDIHAWNMHHNELHQMKEEDLSFPIVSLSNYKCD